MSIKTEIYRDEQGFILRAAASKGTHRLEMVFDKQTGYRINGNRRSQNDDALWKALKLLYPSQDRAVLSIPEPLSVSVVQGGKVLLYDDMEDLLKWAIAAGADGTVAADNTFAFSGNQSLKITCGAAETHATPLRYFPMSPRKVVEASAVVCFQDIAKISGFQFYLYLTNGTDYRQAGLVYAPASQLWGNGYKSHALPNPQAYIDASGAWHKIGFVVDFNALLMLRYYVDDKVFEGPFQVAAPVASAGNFYSQVRFDVDNVAGQEAIAWADHVKITEYP